MQATRRSIRQTLPLLLAIGALLTLCRIWVSRFLVPENLLDLAQQISVNAILAYGMTLVILIGGIDLSVGAVVALVGTVTVSVLAHHGLGPGLLAGLGVAAMFGAINGACAARTRMPPFIITLATMLVARGAALRFNEGRPLPVPDTERVFLALGNARVLGIVPLPVLLMATAFVLTAVLLHRMRFGQHLYAIGGNREAARFTGIPLARNEILVYVICSLLAGLAGIIHTSQLYSAEPASGQGFELNAIAAVVVGGTSFTGGIGTMPGTLLGAIIIGILDKGLNQAGVHFSLRYILKGLVILTAVYLDVRRRKQGPSFRPIRLNDEANTMKQSRLPDMAGRACGRRGWNCWTRANFTWPGPAPPRPRPAVARSANHHKAPRTWDAGFRLVRSRAVPMLAMATL
jgi:ribose transport system permease protein